MRPNGADTLDPIYLSLTTFAPRQQSNINLPLFSKQFAVLLLAY